MKPIRLAILFVAALAAKAVILTSCADYTSPRPGGGGAQNPVEKPDDRVHAAAASDTAKSDGVQVRIDNFTFTPQTLTVAPGTKVTWINHDDVPHTVKSTEKKFLSKTLDTDDTFSFTFTDAGTYEYFCTVHNHMTGKIIVK
ncbi:MAG TPA: cupredoxin family copper-binding protein [Planctomycetota bacterium]|nr:cupredoxin family copper-binding protein [Planctomycetota bacterium]